jgi:undecaprenyl-diphosphatase
LGYTRSIRLGLPLIGIPMTLLQAIVLGIVQGLTEFLPVSSTAHLAIVPALQGWDDPGAAFSAVIQIGTLAAVVWYFRSDVVRIGSSTIRGLISGSPLESHDARLGWMIAFATIPIVLAGLLFKRHITSTLRSLYVIGTSLVLLALVLAVAELLAKKRADAGEPQRSLDEANWWDAIFVGLGQTLALIPGVSRSGVTLTCGLLAGLSRETAARFSFLLSLPAVFAAGIYELYKERAELLASQSNIVNLLTATLVSALVGYFAIAFLLRYLKTHSTWVFVAYRIALGLVLIALLQSGRIQDRRVPTDAIEKTVSGRR